MKIYFLAFLALPSVLASANVRANPSKGANLRSLGTWGDEDSDETDAEELVTEEEDILEEEEEEIPPLASLAVWTSPRDDWAVWPADGIDSLTDQVVEGPNVALFDSIHQVSLALGSALELDLQQALHFWCPSSLQMYNACDANCVNNKKFCELPPTDEAHTATTGKLILGEALRRTCIWKMVLEGDTPRDPSPFLDYMFHFHEAKCDEHNYGKSCIQQVYKESQIEETTVVQCAKDSGGFSGSDNVLLTAQKIKEKSLKIDSQPDTFFPYVLLNGNPIAQEVYENPNELLQVVCDAIEDNDEERPDSCNFALEGSPPTFPDTPQQAMEKANAHLQQDALFLSGVGGATTPTDFTSPTISTENRTIVEIWTAPHYDDTNKDLYRKFNKIKYDFGSSIVLRPRNFIYSQEQACEQVEDEEEGLPAMPTVRFTAWYQLSHEDHEHALAFGYDEKDWNKPGQLPAEKMDYESLESDQRQQLKAMGVAQAQWDCYVNHYRNYDWDELEEAQQQHYVTLGWDEDKWESEHSTDIEGNYWEDLTTEQQVAASGLCYTQELWDEVAIPLWPIDNALGECPDTHCFISDIPRYCSFPSQNTTASGLANIGESLRRTCIWELFPNAFFDYWLLFQQNQCHTNSTQECYDHILEKANLNKEQIDACLVNSSSNNIDKNILLEDLVDIQNITFGLYNLDYQDLPIVTVDGEPTDTEDVVNLYATICEKLQDKLQPEDPRPSFCIGNIQANVRMFTQDFVSNRREKTPILNREQRFEKDIAAFAKVEAPSFNKPNHLPILEVWTTPILDWRSGTDSGDGPNIELFDKMRELVIGFGTSILFRPQYYIYNSQELCERDAQGNFQFDDDEQTEVCLKEDCSNQGLYCTYGTDNPDINGHDLLAETLRRTCIWEATGRSGNPDDNVLFFDYLTDFHSHKCHASEDKPKCANDILNEKHMNKWNVDTCVKQSGDPKKERNTVFEDMRSVQEVKFYYHMLNPANLPIVMLNGMPLEEGGTDLSLDELFVRVCSEFAQDDDGISLIPDVCWGYMEETLGEDFNMTFAPSFLEKLEEELNATTVGPSSVAPTDVATTIAPTTEAPENEIATMAPTTEAPETELTAVPTTEVPEGEALVTVSPTTEVPLVQTDAPTDLTASPTVGPLGEVTTEPEATATLADPTDPELTQFLDNQAQQKQQPALVKTEASSQQGGEWGVNSAGDTASPPQRTSGETSETTTERPADSQIEETGTLILEGPPLGEVDNLEDLDMTLVTSALDHMEALQKCDVDTKVLVKKLLALGSGGDVLKQEVAAIESDLPLFMSENCPHKEGEEILERMTDFHKCAMYNLQELIETFPSTLWGVAMRCVNAYSKMSPAEEEQGFVPEECIRTIEANGILGRALFGLYLYPDVSCSCFERLGKNIPECTADVWPIPINGVLIKTQSCLVGQYCEEIDGLCNEKLEILDSCLPSEDVKGRDIACQHVFDACSEIYENVPPMLNAAPLPDACVRVAGHGSFYGKHIVERYDKFRHQCGNNLELWEGHTPVAEFKAFVTDGIMGINLHGFDFLSGIGLGCVLGITFAIVFVIVRNICRCVCGCLSRCCCRKREKRPRTKDYTTVDTNGEDVPEYKD